MRLLKSLISGTDRFEHRGVQFKWLEPGVLAVYGYDGLEDADDAVAMGLGLGLQDYVSAVEDVMSWESGSGGPTRLYGYSLGAAACEIIGTERWDLDIISLFPPRYLGFFERRRPFAGLRVLHKRDPVFWLPPWQGRHKAPRSIRLGRLGWPSRKYHRLTELLKHDLGKKHE